jgi:hypothetical protein
MRANIHRGLEFELFELFLERFFLCGVMKVRGRRAGVCELFRRDKAQAELVQSIILELLRRFIDLNKALNSFQLSSVDEVCLSHFITV